MRPSGVELAAAFADGVTARASTSSTSGWPPPTSSTSPPAGSTRPARCSPPRTTRPQYNGIKLCLAGARPVGEDTGLAEIKADGRQPAVPPAAEPGHASASCDLLGEFADARAFLRRHGVAAPAQGRRRHRQRHGRARRAARCSSGCPFDLEILYPELDGTFPNHPADPIQPENLKDLQARVLETGADVGLAFDGDADRVFLVDEQAKPVSRFDDHRDGRPPSMLDQQPGATVIYNLICSKAVPEVIREHGGSRSAPGSGTRSSRR